MSRQQRKRLDPVAIVNRIEFGLACREKPGRVLAVPAKVEDDGDDRWPAAVASSGSGGGCTSSSSPVMGSSGVIGANPIASRALPSNSNGTPVSWLS